MRWTDFWDTDNPIYVSDRHKRLHCRMVARDLLALMNELALPWDAAVLDYGCGEALAADHVARHASRLVLCDAAPKVRTRLSAQFANHPVIAVLAPDEVEDLPDRSFDLVVVNSLVQYLDMAEFASLLARWRAKLRAGGYLVLSDIIPRKLSPITDARALMVFGLRGGFAGAALAGLVRTLFSDYRRLRGTLGLSRYDEAEMTGLLRAVGLSVERRRPNLGHNQARMTFVARA